MCENTLLERLMSKLAEHGADVRHVVEHDGSLREELGTIIRKAVRHEVLFDGGLLNEARMLNWCAHDQESCAKETPQYMTSAVAEEVSGSAELMRADLENSAGYAKVSRHLVVMYAQILGLEYTVRRLYGMTPTVEQAADF